jgi:PPOX class probable F420-dependent enzyme
MNEAMMSLRGAKTVVLTSFKQDGTPVETPVSIAVDGDRAYFRSYDKAWKTRRLARNPRVRVAPSSFRGVAAGPAVEARARLVEGEEAQGAAGALARRHPVLQGVVVPLMHRLRGYRTMHYELHFGDQG